MPLISVLMSVHNGQRWLSEAIASVLSQSHHNFEFIIVNDGSTDTSLQVIERYASEDDRIRVLNKKNTGLAHSLNEGISWARGEWIARIDADDVCEPRRLELQLAYTKADERLILVGSAMYQINEVGSIERRFHYPIRHEDLTRNLMRLDRFFPHSSAFFRLESFRKAGGYRVKFTRAQDYDLWLRLSRMGRIGCLQAPLVRIRRHDRQISHEEAGRSQITDARMALACHLLKCRGEHDPLETASIGDNTDAFRDFLKNGLRQSGIFERAEFIRRLKSCLRSQSAALAFFKMLTTSSNWGHIIEYVRDRAVGETVTYRIIDDWLARET
jgi:hypothetical protein